MHYDATYPQYATVAATMERFGLSRPTLYRLIRRGVIEAVKVGRSTRIVTGSVEAYFAGLPRLGS